MKVSEIQAKSILTKSGLPGADFVINPYSGCAFGCVYCYADFTRRFSGHVKDKWGEYVDIKINAAEVLEKEIKSLMKDFDKQEWKGGKYPIILISSVVDPYQGIESKYQLTRKCLEVLEKNEFPGEVSILTKSPLVVRDIDVFKKLKKINVGMTITSTDDKVSRMLEKNAPIASERISALKTLYKAGLETYVCINPLLPHFADEKESLENLFREIYEAGTRKIWLEFINLSGTKMNRLVSEMKGKVEENILEKFHHSQTEDYKNNLSNIVFDLLEKYPFFVYGGGIIDHKEIIKNRTTFLFKKSS